MAASQLSASYRSAQPGSPAKWQEQIDADPEEKQARLYKTQHNALPQWSNHAN